MMLAAKLYLAVGGILLATILHATEYQGKVVGIADGDTITVLDASMVQHKIRLAGIDAPEKTQAFGHRSKQSLSDMLYMKEVTIQTNKIDRYGREVGKVLHEGKNINYIQIFRGMAWYYVDYQRELSEDDRKLYREAEELARANSIGLWADKEPVSPWKWRRLYGK